MVRSDTVTYTCGTTTVASLDIKMALVYSCVASVYHSIDEFFVNACRTVDDSEYWMILDYKKRGDRREGEARRPTEFLLLHTTQ